MSRVTSGMAPPCGTIPHPHLLKLRGVCALANDVANVCCLSGDGVCSAVSSFLSATGTSSVPGRGCSVILGSRKTRMGAEVVSCLTVEV